MGLRSDNPSPVSVEQGPRERRGGVFDSQLVSQVLLVDESDFGGDERHGSDARADGVAPRV